MIKEITIDKLDKKEYEYFFNTSFLTLLKNNIYGSGLYKLDEDLYYVIKKKYGFKIIELIPFSLYANFKINLSEKVLAKYIEELEKHKYDLIRINIDPLYQNKDKVLTYLSNRGYKQYEYNASVFYIEDTLEKVRKKFNKSTKKHTNVCMKNERIKVFKTQDLKYYEKYYKIYEDSILRWGEEKPFYTKELICSLSNIKNVYLWVGLLDGKMVSGMIVFYSKYGVFDWLAANYIREDISKYRVAVAVQYNVILDAFNKQLKYVNMGASNYNQGVDFFKQRWGTVYEKGYRLEKYSKKMKFFKVVFDEINKIKKYTIKKYFINKIGAVVRLVANKTYDFIVIKEINTLNKDIKALYPWSTTTQSIDYLYLKESLKSFTIKEDDVVLDLGSGKGRIILYLNFKYKIKNIIGVEINTDAFNISKELTTKKLNIELYNLNIFETNLINEKDINKIILFNPFDVDTFKYFIEFLLKNTQQYIEFIYINISQEQIAIAKKMGINYKLVEIDKPIIGIYSKINLIGYINE